MLAALAARTAEAQRSACWSAASPTATRRCWPRSRRRSTCISGGRAVLGIGAAWFEDEHRRLRLSTSRRSKERFERLEDALQHRARDVHRRTSRPRGHAPQRQGALNNPRPIRGDIPIMIGGSGERKTLRMVAQYADGSTCSATSSASSTCSACSRATASAVGRDIARDHQDPLGTLLIAAHARGRGGQGASRQARARRGRARRAMGFDRRRPTRSPSRSRPTSTPAWTAYVVDPRRARPREGRAGRARRSER